jgi:hypothetical protein
MVAATTVPKTRKAMKLKNAAHSTASRGDSTRVDTTVAIEVGGVVEPVDEVEGEGDGDDEDHRDDFHDEIAQACLRAIASMTSEKSSIVSRACSIASMTSFQYNAARALELLGVEAAQRLAVDDVALRFEAVDRIEVRLEALQGAQADGHLDDLLGHLHEHVGLLLELRHRRRRRGRRARAGRPTSSMSSTTSSSSSARAWMSSRSNGVTNDVLRRRMIVG